MQQISLKATRSVTEPVSAIDTAQNDRHTERDTYDTAILQFISDMKLSLMYAEKISPYPILMPRSFREDVENFQHLLFIALSNILDRWWDDSDANFPRRMPLEPHEESVLKVGISYIHHAVKLTTTNV